jgi:hypothetical protein
MLLTLDDFRPCCCCLLQTHVHAVWSHLEHAQCPSLCTPHELSIPHPFNDCVRGCSRGRCQPPDQIASALSDTGSIIHLAEGRQPLTQLLTQILIVKEVVRAKLSSARPCAAVGIDLLLFNSAQPCTVTMSTTAGNSYFLRSKRSQPFESAQPHESPSMLLQMEAAALSQVLQQLDQCSLACLAVTCTALCNAYGKHQHSRSALPTENATDAPARPDIISWQQHQPDQVAAVQHFVGPCQ